MQQKREHAPERIPYGNKKCRVIVSRLNDLMGEELTSLLDLPGRFNA
ncbi:hypothetical protein [Desulfosoma sp.]